MFETTFANKHTIVSIDRMTEHDLLEVVAIEEISNLSPWGWEAYHAELQSTTTSLLLVARVPGNASRSDYIVGFIVVRQMADEIHINNIAVRPDFRGRGVGRQLLQTALGWGRDKQASQAVLEVRAGNQGAQQLYQSCEFEVIGRRPRYYKSPPEDALLMALPLSRTD